MQPRYHIIQGDVLAILKTLPVDYFDACLSDPPYGLSFMGKEWDHSVPSSAVYTELLRVLKPGALGIHFGGTRTFHRLAVNLEDAGFELRDCLSWLYGSGFPKSHNISKAIDKAAGAERAVLGIDRVRGNAASFLGQSDPDSDRYTGTTLGVGTTYITAPATPAARIWDGYGTALKPAWEPALLVQKPLAGTFANNALVHGCGGLNVEGCRVGDEVVAKLLSAAPSAKGGRLLGGSILNTIKGCELGTAIGRFPANLVLDEEAGEALGDAQRFFYCAKVSTKERNAGLEGFEATLGAVRSNAPRASEAEKFPLQRNNHPTLKPIALNEYLARLLLIPARTDGQPRRLLVPFSGAGSELIGALQAGWDEVWGIELDGDYIRIAAARIEHHTGALPLLDLAEAA